MTTRRNLLRTATPIGTRIPRHEHAGAYGSADTVYGAGIRDVGGTVCCDDVFGWPERAVGVSALGQRAGVGGFGLIGESAGVTAKQQESGDQQHGGSDAKRDVDWCGGCGDG